MGTKIRTITLSGVVIIAAFTLTACGSQTPTAAPVTATVTSTATKTAAPVTTTKTVTTTARETETETETVTETPDEPVTITVKGVMDLTGKDNWDKTGSTCAGNGGYDDFKSNTTVTIKSGAGEVLALGALDAGKVAEDDATICRFTFSEEDVPFRDGLITVEVSHRGDLEAYDGGDGTYVALGSIGD